MTGSMDLIVPLNGVLIVAHVADALILSFCPVWFRDFSQHFMI